ncbi:nuclear transport factor 2 family protein [Kribbella sp. NBC_01245]|uniref:nuclear transport factor 2 family protein n=1 Tax=Kribbella sp. NBC_01245 TaxID=2903578 RepID=UPI002E2C4757|nr:nuclear transport factor 2 family protein [Kribbella sp. NBC_01245]
MAAEQLQTFAHRVSAAANSHDIDKVVECFTEDYVNESPVHPARSFRGREQVRRNWTQIFATVPDITTKVLRSHQDGELVWSEWEMRGTRLDGVEHLMRGVMLFTVEGDRARAVRFYLEPVDQADLDADQAVQQLLTEPRP